jgi:hypothetical protein
MSWSRKGSSTMSRGIRKAALAALLVALALAACQPNPISSGVDLLVWRVHNALRPKTPEERCMTSLDRRHDALPGAVAGQVDALAGTDPASVDWEVVFEEAAHDAGLREPGVTTRIVEGDPGVFLVTVSWCYGYADYGLYVVDLAGDVWPVSENPRLTAPREVRWLGDAWAVIIGFGYKEWKQIRLYLVAERDGGWAQIYDSEQTESGSLPLRDLQGIPDLVFEDGYRLLTVKWGEGIVKVYEWQDDDYVLFERRSLEE